MQELKGRIRKNHYELDLEGDQKSITKAVATLKNMKEVTHASLRQRRLELKLTDDVPNTAILAQLFQILFDNKVTLICLRSVGMQTEQAYMDLMEEEENRGFTRLYQTEAA